MISLKKGRKIMRGSQNGKISYLDNACMGRTCPEVLNKIRDFLRQIENISVPPTEVTVEMYGYMVKAREAVARLLNAHSDEIAIIESTSHGLGLIANSIPIERNNNVLVCDLEFFASTLCWKARQEEIGFEIRKVATQNGETRISDFASVIDRNTRAIVISAVQEVNGYRADIRGLSKLAGEYGCYLIVDGIQEAGALKVDLSELDVDVYCSGGHKWLRNPFGTGFLYVNKRIKDRLKPPFYGYFNTLEPEKGWQNYLESPDRTPFDPFLVVQSAQKFETGGTANYMGALGLYENISRMLEYGIENIEKKIMELNSMLIKGLKDLNLEITSSDSIENRSGITSFKLPGGLEQERKLNVQLAANKVFTSLRYTSGIGGIRVSPHYYNTAEDIERLLDVTEKFIKG